jgi:integrase/recombinase XerD
VKSTFLTYCKERFLFIYNTILRKNRVRTLSLNKEEKIMAKNRVTFYGKQAWIKGVRCSFHTFRHTFSKLSVKNGSAGIFDLQQILGHTSMEMVRVYVNLFNDDVLDKHKSFSPLVNLKVRM